MDNASDWKDIESHIERREDGCWTWDGSPLDGNVYRVIAEAYGAPLPAGQKMYGMPNCTLGKECVNPSHLGTGADYVLALNGRRQEIPEPPKTVVVKLTPQDRRFLKSVRVRWKSAARIALLLIPAH
jgi:hypothetical protein